MSPRTPSSSPGHAVDRRAGEPDYCLFCGSDELAGRIVLGALCRLDMNVRRDRVERHRGSHANSRASNSHVSVIRRAWAATSACWRASVQAAGSLLRRGQPDPARHLATCSHCPGGRRRLVPVAARRRLDAGDACRRRAARAARAASGVRSLRGRAQPRGAIGDIARVYGSLEALYKFIVKRSGRGG